MATHTLGMIVAVEKGDPSTVRGALAAAKLQLFTEFARLLQPDTLIAIMYQCRPAYPEELVDQEVALKEGEQAYNLSLRIIIP